MTDAPTSPSGPPRDGRARPLLGRVVLVGVGLALAFVAGELLLRLRPDLLTEEALLRLHWGALEEPEMVTVAHPTCGYVHRPHESHVLEREDFRFTLAADEHGFRNESPWPATAPIVAVGDSMTFSFGVDLPDMWSTLLAEELGVAVLNLGIDGGAPRQALRIYETFGRTPQPELVLFGVFSGNDYIDERTFERWEASGDGGNYAVWRWYGGRQQAGLKQWLGRSYLLVGLREARKGYDHKGMTIDLPDGGRLRLAPGLVEGAVPPNVTPADFERVLTTVTDAREVVEADGAAFVAMLFPTKEEVYLAAAGEPFPDGIGPLLDALTERGVACLDLRPALLERARAGETLFFETDGHPNAKGYVVIAEATAAYLREHGLVE